MFMPAKPFNVGVTSSNHHDTGSYEPSLRVVYGLNMLNIGQDRECAILQTIAFYSY